MNDVNVISVRENHEYAERAVDYMSSRWDVPRVVYADCVGESLYTPSPLPQWYLLEKGGRVIGCAGLITNDFISRADLWPWVCALHVEEAHRGNAYGGLLLRRCMEDSAAAGFSGVYLATKLVGYYERYGFSYLGEGYQVDGSSTHIYGIDLKAARAAKEMNIILRPEREDELGTIYDLISTAFETAKVKDGTEQDFADELRRGGGYIPELALVAEHEGEIVAHIMLTRTYVDLPPGGRYEGLLVAPLSVALQWRDKRIGSILLREGMKRGQEMGWKAVFLCGDPAYYHRFGFRSIADFGLASRNDTPLQFVMAAQLEPGALDGVTGTVDFC